MERDQILAKKLPKANNKQKTYIKWMLGDTMYL